MNDLLWKTFLFHFKQRTESSRQAGPVSQNQIRRREHHTEFGGLFSQASVSGLLKFQTALHHAEDVFHPGADG